MLSASWWNLRSSVRQRKADRGTVPFLAFDADRPFVGLHKRLDDREAQSGAPLFRGVTHALREHLVEEVGGYSRSGITHPALDPAP